LEVCYLKVPIQEKLSVCKIRLTQIMILHSLHLLDEIVPPPALRAYTFRARLAPSQTPMFITPGQKVDVMVNLRESFSKQAGGRRTAKLVEAVTVLDVERPQLVPAEEARAGGRATSLTIKVTPAQANMLDLGQQMGELMVLVCQPEEPEFAPATIQSLRSFGKLQPSGPATADMQ